MLQGCAQQNLNELTPSPYTCRSWEAWRLTDLCFSKQHVEDKSSSCLAAPKVEDLPSEIANSGL